MSYFLLKRCAELPFEIVVLVQEPFNLQSQMLILGKTFPHLMEPNKEDTFFDRFSIHVTEEGLFGEMPKNQHPTFMVRNVDNPDSWDIVFGEVIVTKNVEEGEDCAFNYVEACDYATQLNDYYYEFYGKTISSSDKE